MEDVGIKDSIVNKANEKELEYSYVDAISNDILLLGRPGTFACGGVLEKAELQLHIKGYGNIQLPLSYKQGQDLKNKCTLSPFDRGSKTAWQIEAKEITLDHKFNDLINKEIADFIPALMGESFTEGQHVESKLYKLVYYEKQNQFLTHYITEKAPGIFATLVVQLPADHMGGALVVCHKGKQKKFNFENNSIRNYFYTAFFADCDHELKKVTTGHQLVLVYNLVHKNLHLTFNPNNIDNIIKAKNKNKILNTMRKSVKIWKSDNEGPDHLVFPLDHWYSINNKSFQNLKGKDYIIADALCSCEDIEIYIATLTKEETRTGCVECHGSCQNSWEDMEIEECTYTLDNWVGVNNEEPHFGEYEITENEMLLDEKDMFLGAEEKHEVNSEAGRDLQHQISKEENHHEDDQS